MKCQEKIPFTIKFKKIIAKNVSNILQGYILRMHSILCNMFCTIIKKYLCDNVIFYSYPNTKKY